MSQLAAIEERYEQVSTGFRTIDERAGKLEGTVITCPLHGSKFDLKDGNVVSWLGMKGVALKAAGALHVPKTLNVYKVEMDGDSVFVEV